MRLLRLDALIQLADFAFPELFEKRPAVPFATAQAAATLNNQVPAEQRGQGQAQHYGLDHQAGFADQPPDGGVFERSWGLHGACPFNVSLSQRQSGCGGMTGGDYSRPNASATAAHGTYL
ncbi:hypothetical protein D3C76_1532650 [compost metagenome]